MHNNKLKKIAVADDHQVIIDGISALMAEFDDVEIVLTARNGDDLLNQLEHTKADIIIMDINMPGKNGIEASKIVKSKYPDTSILILSMHDQLKIIKDCLKAGVDGYILKETGIDEIRAALTAVSNGETHFSKPIVDKIIARKPKPKSKRPSLTKRQALPASVLTAREVEILQLICEEYTTGETAAELFISINTVETHRRNLLEKTGSKNIAGLFRYAMKHKLLLEDNEESLNV